MKPSYKLEWLFKKKDDFYFDRVKLGNELIEEEDYALVLCDDYKRYVKYVNENNIDKLIVEVRTSNITNLKFLKDMPTIEHLWVYGDIDIDYVYKHKKLKRFSHPTQYKGIIEIDKINGLESFSTWLPENVMGWDNCPNLKSLYINGYSANKPKIRKLFKDLTVLKNLKSLDVLMVSNMSLKTLDGIEGLKNLKVLRLQQNSTFHDLSAIRGVKGTLQQLRLEWCPKIEDFDPIHDLHELRFLLIDKNKHIKKLDLSKFPYLSYLGLVDCVFEDGDLTGVTELDYVPILPLKRNLYIIKDGEKVQLKENMIPYGNFDAGESTIERWRRSTIATITDSYVKKTKNT